MDKFPDCGAADAPSDDEQAYTAPPYPIEHCCVSGYVILFICQARGDQNGKDNPEEVARSGDGGDGEAADGEAPPASSRCGSSASPIDEYVRAPPFPSSTFSGSCLFIFLLGAR